jgi:hypothetical protein
LSVETLIALDRCDRCGAQAYMHVAMPARGELMFCAHHGRKYTPKLLELEATIRDQSDRLG